LESSNQLDLFQGQPKQLVPASDLCAGYHVHADTSVEAFQTTSDSTRHAQRSRILEYIRSCAKGATCDEVEVALHLNHQGASARITELSALSLISHGDERRKTRAGKSARVYRISQLGAQS
jgi:hypothetical protein